MKVPGRLPQLFWVLALLTFRGVAPAQEKPLLRRFIAGAEEHYQLTLTIKGESHSIATETVAAQTYVSPLVHSAEVSMHWRASRRVQSVAPDGSAQLEERLEPSPESCDPQSPAAESPDSALRASLHQLCASLLRQETIRYSESVRGSVHETAEAALAPLGESAPPFLALWLRRALRPSVIFPSLAFAVGANTHQSFQPAALNDAHGSESTEWLDAPGETPAAMLHVVQQLAWKSAAAPSSKDGSAANQPQRLREESFFADSLTTVSLLDGSVLRASRTASRTTNRPVASVPGLPAPPDFSSKLTLLIAIERLP